ncbi:MAG TPA: PQQ-dependent sugar dehydrogenase [Solirubrobacteraceae bacterium]|nr:PQQ-dependent sugar dehydrogenase [Solirubrobacteraceae bacterium]
MPSRLARTIVGFLALLALSSCGSGDDGSTPSAGAGETTAATPDRPPAVRVIATGLQVPWGLAFLPGGDALVSERTTGRILRVPAAGGPAQEVMRVPGVDTNAGEGGLLGLAVSPTYAQDQLVYAYLTSAQDNRVVRFRLGDAAPHPILTGLDRNAIHDGGQIAFGPDRMLYVGTGDAGNSAVAQDPESLNGKILRLRPDGGVPPDNPFRGSPVWSVGHRNVQGLAWDGDGRLWETEFGQDAADEINLIRPARNYGWPRVEGAGDTAGGRYTNPRVTWSPADASPSGAAVAGDALYVGALRGQRLWRVPLDGARTGEPQALLDGEYGRLRTVVRAPDGALWVTTSNRDGRGTPAGEDDRIIRVQPR